MGSVIEATLFSFALGDRIALERRAKIEEQAALLERERTLRAELQASHRQELLAQQKMVAAEAESRAKTRFLATMSHEIRTPLNGVLGMIELLQASGLAPAQRKYADVIARSGQTLLSVINDILDFSKISAGKMQLEELDFDLEQLCTECAGTFSYSAEKNGIALEVRYAADVPVFVHGDPARIRQILLNLLGNAFKFTERGRVELQVSRVLQHGKECLHLAVSDTGIGISEDMQGQLFDSFAQADVSTTRRYGGTGLGLAISKQLSLLMGGDMGLQSRAGEGSTFWFSLPCHPADTAPMMRQGQDLQAHAFPAPGYPGRTVLVVDDNEVNLTVITAILKKLDIRVLQARGGEQAVAYAGHHHDTLDLILMDCEMPGLDGFAATRRIRAQEAADGLPAVPIVALTAHALPEYQTRCLESGMTGYLAKPVQVRVLAARLAKIWAIGPD